MHDLIEKTKCILVEKCYHSNFKIIVYVPNIEILEKVNKLLWTYSQKQFIPHGSKLDPLPHAQPVYITDEFKNPNQANAVILVNPLEKQMLEIIEFQSIENNVKFNRICVIHDDYSEYYKQNLEQMANSLINNGYDVESYDQNSNGSWNQLKFTIC